MAKQLNFLAGGRIVPTALHQEMERSYLEYAMSVIVGRALPDVRDGLKPVHRRVLYAMHELGLTPDRPFRKCARVVGDVLGKYHPHGDQSVYEALVRMAQDFSSRYPLLSGHGNFGSIDNDPPAAMRYTETRLAGIADRSLLDGIGESIVNFIPNFDNSAQEPEVLPAKLPILLLNGCSGIAVGMATNIPPHNLNEIVDGTIALIDNPDLGDDKLLEIVPGPDFPTGGEIVDTAGIKEAYRTGRGIIPVRGITKVETLFLEGKRRRERTALVVTELPYQVNKAAWIEKVAELVNQGKLEGIGDIRDESDREGIRVVIELKKEFTPRQVLDELHRQTALQSNFGIILLALVDNQPRQLSLKELLAKFIDFRSETLTKQYNDRLNAARERLHLVEGLLLALNRIDRVVDILKNAPDGTTAKYRFQEELDLSDAQSDSILAMPLRRLTGLERRKLEAESESLRQTIEQLETLLNNRHEFLKALKKELRGLKKNFGDDRRTRIKKPELTVKSEPVAPEKTIKTRQKPETTPIPAKKSEVGAEKKPSTPKQEGTPTLTLFAPEEPPENAELSLTSAGRVFWSTPDDRSPEKENIIYREAIDSREHPIVILDTGKAYPIPMRDIPPTIQPIYLTSLLTKTARKESESVLSLFFPPLPRKNQNLILLTRQGRLKRLPLSELEELGNRGLSLIKLKEDDRLIFSIPTEEGKNLLIATSSGRVLRYPVREELIPPNGRNTQGNPMTRLRHGESIVGCLSLDDRASILLISAAGYGKRLQIKEIRLSQLGDLGSPCLQFATKTDSLAAMVTGEGKKDILIITDSGREIRIEAAKFKLTGKDGTGDRAVQLKAGEKIAKVLVLES